jgi:type III secretory pathway component EscR
MIGKTEDDRTYLANNANVAVCDFFKVDQQQLFSKTRKKNKDDISVYLPNIDDIRKKFKDTEYEWMVE